MENLFELRLETKRLLRDNKPSQKEYEEALPLCRELWEAFSETNNLWDAQQYANCLKQLNMNNEAEEVCDNIYNLFKEDELISQEKAYQYILRIYASVIYSKYIKDLKSPNYEFKGILLEKIQLFISITDGVEWDNYDFVSYSVISGLSYLNKNDNSLDYVMALEILNKLDVKTLSDKPYQYKDSNDKERESASRKEEYYTLKTDLLLKNKQYDECILYCNEALEEITTFHYSNEIWLERKIALALDGIGEATEAINRLKKLIVTSDKWFLLYEIGKLYLKLGNKDDALQYMLKALCTKDPEKMKVKLIEQLGDVLSDIGEIEYAQENYSLAIKIKKENEWFVKDSLLKKVGQEREVLFKDVRRHWIQLLYKYAGKKTGRIDRLLPGNKAGFIKAEKSYYFQSKNFFGRIDMLKVGDSVDFSTCVSYDRKKQQETIEAIAITPIKRNN